jgi:cytochrome c
VVADDPASSKANVAAARPPDGANVVDDDRMAGPRNEPGVEPCMTNCLPEPAVAGMRAAILDVTPDGEGQGRNG